MSMVQEVKLTRRIPRATKPVEKGDPHAAEMATARKMLEKDRKKSKAVKEWKRGSHCSRAVFVRGQNFSGLGSFWGLPATGGMQGGIYVGQAVAQDHLTTLHRNAKDPSVSYTLAWAAESLAWRIAQVGGWDAKKRPADKAPGEVRALFGQPYGFYSTLAEWLCSAAEQLGSKLDRLTSEEIDRRIREGLVYRVTA